MGDLNAARGILLACQLSACFWVLVAALVFAATAAHAQTVTHVGSLTVTNAGTAPAVCFSGTPGATYTAAFVVPSSTPPAEPYVPPPPSPLERVGWGINP